MIEGAIVILAAVVVMVAALNGVARALKLDDTEHITKAVENRTAKRR